MSILGPRFFVHFDRDDVDYIFRGVGMGLESDVVSFVALQCFRISDGPTLLVFVACKRFSVVADFARHVKRVICASLLLTQNLRAPLSRRGIVARSWPSRECVTRGRHFDKQLVQI